MTAVLIILALMSVPLAGIVSKTYLRKRELDALANSSLAGEVKRLQGEVKELRDRVETLETIATGAGALCAPAEPAMVELELAARRSRAS